MKKNKIAKLVRQARRSLGLKGQSQQVLLRQTRERLHLTNEALANTLDVSLPTLIAWLAPKSAGKHRTMPTETRLLLLHLLAATDE